MCGEGPFREPLEAMGSPGRTHAQIMASSHLLFAVRLPVESMELGGRDSDVFRPQQFHNALQVGEFGPPVPDKDIDKRRSSGSDALAYLLRQFFRPGIRSG